jgi:hypothetical protein
MSATTDFEVKISSYNGQSRQPMRAVQNGWVSAEHLMDYGACFPEEIQFPEEQLIDGKFSDIVCPRFRYLILKFKSSLFTDCNIGMTELSALDVRISIMKFKEINVVSAVKLRTFFLHELWKNET